jgi:hypothetical protein
MANSKIIAEVTVEHTGGRCCLLQVVTGYDADLNEVLDENGFWLAWFHEGDSVAWMECGSR